MQGRGREEEKRGGGKEEERRCSKDLQADEGKVDYNFRGRGAQRRKSERSQKQEVPQSVCKQQQPLQCHWFVYFHPLPELLK